MSSTVIQPTPDAVLAALAEPEPEPTPPKNKTKAELAADEAAVLQ